MIGFRFCQREASEIRKRRAATKELAESAAGRKIKISAIVVVLAGLTREQDRGVFQLLALVYRPGLAEMLAALLANALLIGRVEVIHLDGKLPAHMIEQHLCDPLACFGRRSRQCGVAVRPVGLGCPQFLQRLIVDLQQSALLQIWQRDTPAAFQIAIKAVTEDGPERTLRVLQRLKPHRRVSRVQFDWQFQCLEHPLRQFIVGDPSCPAFATAL